MTTEELAAADAAQARAWDKVITEEVNVAAARSVLDAAEEQVTLDAAEVRLTAAEMRLVAAKVQHRVARQQMAASLAAALADATEVKP